MTKHPARMLYHGGDVAYLRGAEPPVLAIVLSVSAARGRVRVGYYDADDPAVRRWVEPADLVQVTVQYAVQGIPEHLQTLRG